MKQFLCVWLLLVPFLQKEVCAQISPPGMGKAHTANWFALGIRQDLDTARTWKSMSYVGLGRKSNPDNCDPFLKPAILVFNQEFSHTFYTNWKYAFALSYRRQDEYRDEPPYTHNDPELRQETRIYGKLSYAIKTPRIKVVPTFRQEYRAFFLPETSGLAGNRQWRTRVRLQCALNLDTKHTHRMSASVEQLFSVNKETPAGTWTNFQYRESRFQVYYSYAPQQLPFVFSIGYMNNLVGSKSPYDVHYLAFDCVLENPFGQQSAKKR